MKTFHNKYFKRDIGEADSLSAVKGTQKKQISRSFMGDLVSLATSEKYEVEVSSYSAVILVY